MIHFNICRKHRDSISVNWFQNYAKYKDGKITGKEFLIALSKDTGKAAAISAGFTGGLVLGTAICKHLATSSSNIARMTGNYLGKLLGPTVLVGALGYQASFTQF